jgi:hypothetical protein
MLFSLQIRQHCSGEDKEDLQAETAAKGSPSA